MKIISIAAGIPSKKVSNEYIIDLIKKYSPSLDPSILRKTNMILNKTGARTRYWCDEKDNAFELTINTIKNAIKKANLTIDDISTIIHCGVIRPFSEPNTSYILAKALGSKNAECFDVIDACSSWVRSLKIINDQNRAIKKYSLVVSTEFGVTKEDAIYPYSFQINNETDLEYKLPGITIGEATTATIVSNENAPIEFTTTSNTDLANLCYMPNNKGAEEYKHLFTDYCSSQIGRFVSYGEKLHNNALDDLINNFISAKLNIDEAKVIIPHSSSKHVFDSIADKMGIKEKLHHIYDTHGNVVSSSLPLGIHSAISNGKVKKDENIICWMAAAGGSTTAFELTCP